MAVRATKERWGREAIAITDALTKDGNGQYLCPLCLDWYTDLDGLSLEQAPPESIGGFAGIELRSEAIYGPDLPPHHSPAAAAPPSRVRGRARRARTPARADRAAVRPVG